MCNHKKQLSIPFKGQCHEIFESWFFCIKQFLLVTFKNNFSHRQLSIKYSLYANMRVPWGNMRNAFSIQLPYLYNVLILLPYGTYLFFKGQGHETRMNMAAGCYS